MQKLTTMEELKKLRTLSVIQDADANVLQLFPWFITASGKKEWYTPGVKRGFSYDEVVLPVLLLTPQEDMK